MYVDAISHPDVIVHPDMVQHFDVTSHFDVMMCLESLDQWHQERGIPVVLRFERPRSGSLEAKPS